ncbi:uncharacterized protein B0H18DRAFT_539597 [Fomitopsis serialis]|uniref:uncharacterized protein n=1 Tax=Fomitopsis serialis TaxID=139415 RepID=UPI002008C7BD|nr:uncharacterized protein B0H18DRAFT_539597 [Neoantrodia serialis]KAH9908836.1 hypothetical protein B0H18DRAFT_539597 [Neoantrodia serialis]
MSSIRTFATLRRLRLGGRPTGVAASLDAINAPNVDEVELSCHRGQGDETEAEDADALYATFGLLCRRNAMTLRSFKFHFRNPTVCLFPSHWGATNPFGFANAASPLLELCCLQDVELLLYSGMSPGHHNCRHVNAAALLLAWPTLRTLSLPGVSLTPEALQAIARMDHGLQSLTVQMLSQHFLDDRPGLPATPPSCAADPDARTPALRELRVNETSYYYALDIVKLACFLDPLFPLLERCSVPSCPERDHSAYHGINAWYTMLEEESRVKTYIDVMKEVEKLRLARQNTKPVNSESSCFADVTVADIPGPFYHPCVLSL